MSIVYYPDRVYKKVTPAIDRVMAQRDTALVRGRKDATSEALDVVISANKNWNLNSVKFTFSNANSRNFTAEILSGKKVISGLNDYLWIQHVNTIWQKITIDPGFYTGTELAAQLQTKLQANVDLAAVSTLTVAYVAATGLFTITSSAGNIRYIQKNNTQQLSERDSIAGHLFGLTADTAFASTITSTVPSLCLDESAPIVDQSASSHLYYYHDDIHVLNEDQALKLSSNVASVAISYEVNYEEIV